MKACALALSISLAFGGASWAEFATAKESNAAAAARIAELAKKFQPGTPEEYVHIPAIWEESIAAAKRNEPAEIVAILELALPKADEPLHDWQAVVIGGGLINGLTQAGVWPAQRIAELLEGNAALQARWRQSTEAAVAMADNDSVRSGTRYDALRMLGATRFKRRADQLRKYLETDVDAELQAGAIGALSDMRSPAAAEAIVAAFGNLAKANQTAAIDALLRSKPRAAILQVAVETGAVAPDAISAEQSEKLKQLAGDDAKRKPKSERFKELFNGRDLAGWEGDKKIWSVEDGLLTGQTKSDKDIQHNTFAIWTGGEVGDFELQAIFRLEGENNSGVQYRSRREPKTSPWTVVGYQADIHPAANYLGMLYDEGGRGIVAEHGQQAIIAADGKKEIKALPGKVEPVDLSEWTTLEISAKDNRLVHKINGQVTVKITDDEAKHADAKGILALQVHAGPPMKVQFKSIKLAQGSKNERAGAKEVDRPKKREEAESPSTAK